MNLPAKLVQRVHFEDFDGKQFERLVLAYHLRVETWHSLDWYGQTGSDLGRDIWGVRTNESALGETVCIQCANRRELPASKAIRDVENVLRSPNGRPDVFRLVCAGPVSAKKRDQIKTYVASRGIKKCDIWSGEEFEERLRASCESLLQRFVNGVPFPDTLPDLRGFLREEVSHIASKREWKCFFVKGTDLRLLSGVAGTYESPNAHSIACFSRHSTVILGGASEEAMSSISGTSASWHIRIEQSFADSFDQGLLLIGCIRYFGGLHSRERNERITVSINNEPVDRIALKVIPPDHSDYFHRPKLPEFPRLPPFTSCQTLYAWTLQKERLLQAVEQIVTVVIDKYVRWDIDYVGLLLKKRRRGTRIFLCHGSEDKATVREIYAKLKAAGLDPWLDEEDIMAGEEWDPAIRNAVRNCDIVLVCLSSKSVNKTGYVQKEIRFALDRADEKPEGTLYIMPLRLDDCPVPQRLSRWQWIDFFKSKDQAYEKLLLSIDSVSEGMGSD